MRLKSLLIEWRLPASINLEINKIAQKEKHGDKDNRSEGEKGSFSFGLADQFGGRQGIETGSIDTCVLGKRRKMLHDSPGRHCRIG